MGDRLLDFQFDNVLRRLDKVPATIVEIGTMRFPDAKRRKTDGGSTFHWARMPATVHTVDRDMSAISTCYDLLMQERIGENVLFHCMDGVEFLQIFKIPIGVLYIDAALDADLGEELIRHANMAPQSMILIDDTDVANKGKGQRAIPYARHKGYSIEGEITRQCLLTKGI